MNSKVNFNETIISFDKLPFISAFSNGDFVFQPIIIKNNQFLFWDECYFNLMASMRKMRMDIPLTWTQDFFKNQIYQLEDHFKNGIAEIQVYRQDISQFIIRLYPATKLQPLKIDLYKDIELYPTYLSGINIIHPENIPAKKYAAENDLDDIIFLNSHKKIARTIFGNIFLLQDNKLIFNGVEEGAYKNAITNAFEYFITRTKIVEIITQPINPFETQKAEEIFILSETQGIIPVNQIRNKIFKTVQTKELERQFELFWRE